MESASGCFIEWENKILILHRPPTKDRGSEWGLVAGKIDSGESREQALLREIKEETGFDASHEKLEFLGTYVLSYPDADWEFHTYRIKLEKSFTPRLDPTESTEYRWVTSEECFAMPDLMSGLYVLLQECGYIKL